MLGAERIDHGVQALKDPLLVERLAKERIPLTVCPLSNVKLCVFTDMSQHTIGELLDQGLVATINSDDPAYFGGYLNSNFLATFEALQLRQWHAQQLARNSFEACFVDDATKAGYIAQLERFTAEFA